MDALKELLDAWTKLTPEQQEVVASDPQKVYTFLNKKYEVHNDQNRTATYSDVRATNARVLRDRK